MTFYTTIVDLTEKAGSDVLDSDYLAISDELQTFKLSFGELKGSIESGLGLSLYEDNFNSTLTPTNFLPIAIGNDSVAIGISSTSTGTRALALGYLSEATGINSVAIGGGKAGGIISIAIGNNATTTTVSTAIGNDSYASGSQSIAIGSTSRAEGLYSFAGNNSKALSNYSTAIGSNSSGYGSIAETGAGAIALGGSYASGINSFAAAIGNNTSSYGALADGSIALGNLAKASGSNGIALGDNSIASGTYAIAIGRYAEANADYSFSVGRFAKASITGQNTYASGRFSFAGDAQSSLYVLRMYTTNAVPTVLTTTGGTYVGPDNQIILSNYSAVSFHGTIVAKQRYNQGQDYAAWEIKGAVSRDNGAASTVLGSYNINTLSKTSGSSSWSISLEADTTNGGLAIKVIGSDPVSIRWVASIRTSEVIYNV